MVRIITGVSTGSTPLARMALGAAVLALAAACTPTTVVPEPVEPTGLNRSADRISDAAIASDRAYIASLRQRLKALNDAGRPLDDYSMCKATAWIDFAYAEYTDNDRSGIVDDALAEAKKLIVAMEAGGAEGYSSTPVLPASQRIRDDLWQYAAAQKKGDLPPCARCDLARLEVQLVWAGNEYKDLGWRHADSAIRAAERYQRDIAADAARCPKIAETQPAVAAPAPRAPLTVPVDVHFPTDKTHLGNETAAILARVAQVLRERPELRVTLAGYADVRGTHAKNEALSRRRAEAVRAYLIVSGVDAGRITTRAEGETEVHGPDLKPIEAYARARRVDLVFEGATDLQTEHQLLDIQPDR